MKNLLILLLLTCSTFVFGQDKDKVKGSKNVKKETHMIDSVSNIEIEDNLTVTFVKGNKFAAEIEADDNLHEFIKIETFNDKVRLFTTKKITSSKKLHVIITYTDQLNSITTRHEAVISSFAEIEIEKFTVSTYDYAEIKLNVKSKDFNLFASDKTKSELNITAPTINIQGKNNAKIELLINGENLNVSLVEKSDAKIEGNIANSTYTISGKCEVNSKNSISKTVTIKAIENSDINTYASDKIDISASGDAKIALYGDPIIAITEFKNNVSLLKKEK